MGGLDDLIPDDDNSTGRSSSRSTSTSSDDKEYVEEFHSDSGVKKFTEDRWEEIKKQISQKTEYSVGEVKSMEANKRHEVLHEMALASDNDRDPEELEHGTEVQCAVCGCDCSFSHVIVHGEKVCIQHPIAAVAKETDLEFGGEDNQT